MADGICAETRSWVSDEQQLIVVERPERPHLSISRIHAESVGSSFFDNFWQLAG